MIAEAVAPLAADRSIPMGTLCRRIDDPADFANPNVVKVVVDRAGFALYFSRAPIPFTRDAAPGATPTHAFKHIGLYVYQRAFLLRVRRARPDAARAGRVARAAARARARVPHPGGGNHARLGRGGHPGRSRTGAAPRGGRAPQLSHHAEQGRPTGQVHLRHGRRGLVARARAWPPRPSARCSRRTATGSRCRSSIRTSTSTRAR